jgi:hypothetical protein
MWSQAGQPQKGALQGYWNIRGPLLNSAERLAGERPSAEAPSWGLVLATMEQRSQAAVTRQREAAPRWAR